jgi:hypothetical protein
MVINMAMLMPAWAQSAVDVADAREKYPAAWACAHTGAACTDDFIQALAADLYAKYPNVGLNGKRGNYGDLSDDALAVFVESNGDCVDQRTGRQMIVVDVIGGAGGPNPSPAWARVGCGAGNPGAWVQPGGATRPLPNPPVQEKPLDLRAIELRLQALEEAITGLQGDLLDREYVIESINGFKEQLNRIENRVETTLTAVDLARQQLQNPPTYKGSLFGLGITLRPQP